MAIKDTYNQYHKAVADARAILDRASSEGRELTADETAQYERVDAEIDRLGNELQKAQQAAKPAPRVQPVAAGASGLEIDFPGFQLGRALSGRMDRRIKLGNGDAEYKRAGERYAKNFLRYLAYGERESLGLQVAKSDKGGYLAGVEFTAKLIKFLDNLVFMRELATVLPPMPSAVSLGVPTWDTDPANADWTAEVPASQITADDTATTGRREFVPHLLTKLVAISLKLLRTSVIDIEDLLVQRLAYVFAITEENAFLNGTGAQQPLGIFVASANGIDTGRDFACAAVNAFTADEVIETFFALKAAYQRNATWVASREWVKRVRKLKDSQNNYLWQPGMGLGAMPGTILDRPYVMSEYSPNTFTTGKYVAVVGDFRAGYWIGDSLAFETQRLDQAPFALQNQVGVLARKETDGTPVLAEAFSRMKLA